MPIRVPFRWADFAVAAGIFVAGVLTLLPAIQRSRERMNQAGCVFNLQQLGNSFGQYASLHPVLALSAVSIGPTPPPGSFAVDAARRRRARRRHAPGLPVQRPVPAREPGAGRASTSSSASAGPIRRSYQRMLCWDYAYNVGYRHASQHPGPLEVVHSSRIPVLADQPDHDDFWIKDGNSPNHGGRGQNVLFGDGSVRWFRTRHVSPTTRTSISTTTSSRGRASTCTTRSWCPSHTPFRGW